MKIIALVFAIATALQAADETSQVLARLDAYMAAYEPRLSELVADEQMEQWVHGPGRGLRRVLTSEVAFIELQNSGWLGIRHVRTVNKKSVSSRTISLEATLKLPNVEAARTLLRNSAAHNLGLARTTNLPNLPLEFLHVRNRHRLEPRMYGRVMVRGVETTRIMLDEKVTPTLITNPKTGADMPAEINAWIDDQGRLLRAEVATFTATRKAPHQHLIRVEFAETPALGGLLVPTEMYEEFAAANPQQRGTAIATYANFRKFQTSARIVPQ